MVDSREVIPAPFLEHPPGMTDTRPRLADSTHDRALLARAARGDERAVAGLFDRYGRVLYAVAFRISGERADAEEIVSDAFAQAWRDAPRFDAERGSVPAWLTMITRSRALDLVRARNRRHEANRRAAAGHPEGTPGAASPVDDPATAVDQAERRVQVLAALDALTTEQRTAIELAFYGGLTHSEIADQLGEPLGTVKSRIRAGMQKLRESLRPYFYGPPA